MHAVVLTGVTGCFSAGADIKEFSVGLSDPTFSDLGTHVEQLGKPVVAAIEGHALGGGLELALACHYRFAAPSSCLALPEVHLGILPAGGGYYIFILLQIPHSHPVLARSACLV